MAAKFEIASAKTGQFNWVLKSQGRTLATGEPYGRRALAEKAVEALRKAVAGATVSDLTVAPKAAPAKRTAKPAKATKAAKATARPAKATRNSAKTGGAAKATTTAAKAATKGTARAKATTNTASTAKKSAARRTRSARKG